MDEMFLSNHYTPTVHAFSLYMRLSSSHTHFLPPPPLFLSVITADIPPSPPLNVSLVSQQLNSTVRMLSITLRLLPPKHSAGVIVGFKVKFGGPKVPNSFDTFLPVSQ